MVSSWKQTETQLCWQTILQLTYYQVIFTHWVKCQEDSNGEKKTRPVTKQLWELEMCKKEFYKQYKLKNQLGLDI